jgi:hypothetical protein
MECQIHGRSVSCMQPALLAAHASQRSRAPSGAALKRLAMDFSANRSIVQFFIPERNKKGESLDQGARFGAGRSRIPFGYPRATRCGFVGVDGRSASIQGGRRSSHGVECLWRFRCEPAPGGIEAALCRSSLRAAQAEAEGLFVLRRTNPPCARHCGLRGELALRPPMWG